MDSERPFYRQRVWKQVDLSDFEDFDDESVISMNRNKDGHKLLQHSFFAPHPVSDFTTVSILID